MSDANLRAMGAAVFNEVQAKGKRLLAWYMRPFIGDRSLLTLHELTEIAVASGQSLSGEEDIRLNMIVGSENRKNDFAEGFLPIRIDMSERWINVWMRMNQGLLEEPINVFEYGNVYFIRDGHHRVSTALRLGRKFIRARVTRLSTPYCLNCCFSRKDLPYFRKLVNFNKKTRFLDNVHHAKFDIRRNNSWNILENEIRKWSPSWVHRHKNHSWVKEDFKRFLPDNENLPENIEQQDVMDRFWYYSTYKYIMDFVKRRSLHYLFPRWGDTDVAMELINIWNKYENPDQFTLEDIYTIFINHYRKKHFFMVPFQIIAEQIHQIRRTASDERNRFMINSNIQTFRPEFNPPANSGKKEWRKLYNDLFVTHATLMKNRLKRPPFLAELVSDWYDNVYSVKFKTES